MSFQWVIDNAEQLSLNRSRVVGTTITRSGIARNVVRGHQPWRIEVKLPDGPRWTDYRPYIAALESVDRAQPSTFRINNPGHRWLVGYRGDKSTLTGVTGTWVRGSTSFFVNPITGFTNSYIFRAGDYLQLGNTGRVYQVVEDAYVTSGTTLVRLHRAIVDADATNQPINIAQNATWTVICTQFPQWNLFSRDQVGWSGTFIFSEVVI